MFCQKCGSEMIDGATFCQKCGTKTATGEAQQQTVGTYAGTVAQPSPMPKKKKSKKGIGIIVGIISIILIIAIVSNSGGDSIDYIATAKAYEPFKISQSLPGTYGEVLNKYLNSPNWNYTKDGDIAYVTTSGTLKGSTDKVSITISITPKDEETVTFKFTKATVNGHETTSDNDVTLLVIAFFQAYNDGQELFDPDLYL